MRALVPVILAAALACDAGVERRVAEEAVRAYDRAVIAAHLTARFDALERAATPDEVERVRIIVGGLRARGEELRASLERLSIVGVERLADGAVLATAEEQWWYERVDARSRQATAAGGRRAYDVRYRLVRNGERWVVARVELTAPSRSLDAAAGGSPGAGSRRPDGL